MTLGGPGTAAVAAGLAAASAAAVADRLAGAGRLSADRWLRTSAAGTAVSLAGGVGAAAGLAVGAGVGSVGAVDRSALRAILVAGLAAAAAGRLDDLLGSGSPAAGPGPGARGLRGHARALAHGQLSTGAAKVALIGAGALVAVGLDPSVERGPDRLVAGAVVAGAANLVNLLDLRPARALKAVLVAGVLLGRPSQRAALALLPAAAAAGLLAGDAGSRFMLGDAGANLLGAGLGLAAVHGASVRATRLGLLAVVSATLASEVVSYSAVIEAVPAIRRADRWGR